jgi:hypothetical protein
VAYFRARNELLLGYTHLPANNRFILRLKLINRAIYDVVRLSLRGTPLCDRFQKYLRVVCLRWLMPKRARHQTPQRSAIGDPLVAEFDARKVADG